MTHLTHTAHDYATNYYLWVEYIDPDNVLEWTKEDFDLAAIEHKTGIAQTLIDYHPKTF